MSNPIDIKLLAQILPQLPAKQAVLLRGPTGVGKSAIAKDLAARLNLPLIDVRTAVMQEGDMAGIPNLNGLREGQPAYNVMYGWFVRACREPVVIFLDELPRAMLPVLQGAFQLVLDRQLGNDLNGIPHTLHAGTRVIAAGNFGSEYEGEDLDPAMLRRFSVFDVSPTVEDWLEWAKGNIDIVIIEFIRNHTVHFRVDPANANPGSILPNPATWDAVDKCLKSCGMEPSAWAGQKTTPAGAHHIMSSLVGSEAAYELVKFTSNYLMNISAEDVVKRWDSVKQKVEALPAERRHALAAGIIDYISDNDLNDENHKKNLFAWFDSLRDEELVSTCTTILQTLPQKNSKNMITIHKHTGKRLTDVINTSRSAK